MNDSDGDNLLVDKIHSLKSRKDLAKFLLELSRDCAENQETWPHRFVEHYLEAIAGWLEFSDADPTGKPAENEWQAIAKCFYVGSSYE